MKKIYITALFAFLAVGLWGQNQIISDFSWGSPTSAYTSSDSFALCEGAPNSMTLTSTLMHQVNATGMGGPLATGHPMASVLIPYPNLVNTLNISVTLTFASPVAELQLLIRDLDDDVSPVGPEETFSNFRINGLPMMPSSIAATQGSYSTSGNVVNPLAANCNGWFRWSMPNITTLSFDYWRSTPNYAFLLDSVKVNCNGTWVGIEQAVVPTFEICPNPARDYMDIAFAHTTDSEYSLTMYDAAGRQVYTAATTAASYRLSTEQLVDGIYFLKIQNGDQQSSQKLIVRH